jgi:predicted P-loop ATPase
LRFWRPEPLASGHHGCHGQRRGFDVVGKELVRDAVLRVAEGNTFDSAIEWVQSLRWDGVPRVERFFEPWRGVRFVGWRESFVK